MVLGGKIPPVGKVFLKIRTVKRFVQAQCCCCWQFLICSYFNILLLLAVFSIGVRIQINVPVLLSPSILQ